MMWLLSKRIIMSISFITTLISSTSSPSITPSAGPTVRPTLEGYPTDAVTGIATLDKWVNLANFTLIYDPPNHASSPAAMSIFVRAQIDGVESTEAIVYYCTDETRTANSLGGFDYLIIDDPNSGFTASYYSPYIQIATPYKASRIRYVAMIGTLTVVTVDPTGGPDVYTYYRSPPVLLKYYVEGGARPLSYGFLVPGIESGGYFVRFAMEVEGKARAQAAGGQEFADFFTNLGVGTYETQVRALNLLDFPGTLTGFEGGFAANLTNGKQFGFLIPYHNGEEFFGKVVRVDLWGMHNIQNCTNSYRAETMLPNGVINITTRGAPENTTAEKACVFVIDVASLHPKAVGFRRGFMNYPYGYLSPGEHAVSVRLDLENFGLNTTRVVDLSLVNKQFGGYSGGFADGTWACFSPYRTYSGPIGGLRSTLPVDTNHLRAFFHSTMVCMNSTAWDLDPNQVASAAPTLQPTVLPTTIQPTPRPSLAPTCSPNVHPSRKPSVAPSKAPSVKPTTLPTHSPNTHPTSEPTTFESTYIPELSKHIFTMDFSTMQDDLRGFSDCVKAGRYVYMSPLNSADHVYSSKIVRISLGSVDIGTTLTALNASRLSVRPIVDVLDLSKISSSLAGYSGLFTSGKFLFLVPYRNAYEPSNGQRGHGVITRLNMNDFSLTGIDSLDLTAATRNQIPSFNDVTLRGFSFGFASGQYGVLVPFYNAIFSGKIARFQTMPDSMAGDIQELDMTVDRMRPNIYKGYRGGFVSLWQGVEECTLTTCVV